MNKKLAICIIALMVLGVGAAMIVAYTKDTEVKANGTEFPEDELRDLLREYNVTEDNIAINGLVYTMDELLDLYRKYNISGNDLRFAMDDLPNPLEGTLLDGKHRVIATETGEPPERLPPKWQEGDYILITIEERGAIEKEAVKRYIEKYGMDPGDTKIDVGNGIPFPKEEVKRLIKSGILAPGK